MFAAAPTSACRLAGRSPAFPEGGNEFDSPGEHAGPYRRRRPPLPMSLAATTPIQQFGKYRLLKKLAQGGMAE
ncbi:MAG TPA: hypothetical protein VND93_19190, partial [Myxococcales bacterium]|nr:hypothetical protein [Myxococcales bacterium]